MTKKKTPEEKKLRGSARMKELGKPVYTPVTPAKEWRGANEAGVDLFNAWRMP
jgi:hypothetical protein